MLYDLAIVSVVKNEERNLEEWMGYHRSVGVEQFFLYDNLSTDRTAELATDLGATVTEWPDRYFQQITAHCNALTHYRDDARWLAFIDPDEYVFAPGRGLVELLDEHRNADALAICWACFGTSGYATPQASTLESYLLRSRPDLHIGGTAINRHVKCILQPARVPAMNPPTPHAFWCCETVDVHGRSIEGSYSPEVEWDGIRLNHYISRSEEEARAKMVTPKVNSRLLYDYDLCDPGFNAVYDDSMLAHLKNLSSK